MNKKAFLAGYMDKQAIIGAVIKGAPAVIKGTSTFLGPMVPSLALEHFAGKLQDEEIDEYRRKLGLPPETDQDEQQPEANSRNKLQEEAISGSVSLTT